MNRRQLLQMMGLGSASAALGCGGGPGPIASPSPPSTGSPPNTPGPVAPAAPNGAPLPPYQDPTDAERAAVTDALNAFTLDLYGKLRKPNASLIASPCSVDLALAMTYAGARGETKAEFERVLHLPSDALAVHRGLGALLRELGDPQNPQKLHVANRLFADDKLALKARFQELTKAYYEAPVERADFRGAPDEARKAMNAWVEEQTKEKIQKLFPEGSISPDTRLVLANAIYFKGGWQHAFDKDKTIYQPFWGESGQRRVELMTVEKRFNYGETDEAQIVELSYRGGRQSLTILLPKAKDGLSDLEAGLTHEGLKATLEGMQYAKVRVELPKFEIEPEESLALKEPLQELGLSLPFDRQRADLLDIAELQPPDENYALSNVFHKGFIAVDEEGTEAAAASGAVMVAITSIELPQEPKVFRADHPFLFVLREKKTDAILFMGRYAGAV